MSDTNTDSKTADATLIETAAALLKALKGTLYALDENMDGFGPSKQTAIAEARAVIAQAEKLRR